MNRTGRRPQRGALAWGAVAWLAFWACQGVHAAERTPLVEAGYISHVVAEGESLPMIGQRYLQQPIRWTQLLTLNGLKKRDEPLAAGTIVRIPARLLKASAIQARVEGVHGEAVAERAPLKTAEAGAAKVIAPATRLAPGQDLEEGARVTVPADGYLRLRLADGSVLHVLAGSDVALKRMRRRNNDSDFESVVDVRRGQVKVDVSRQPRGRVFEVHAPGAVASVRGTRFDVSVDPQGRVGTQVTEGEVVLGTQADSAHEGPYRWSRLTAGQSAVLGEGGQVALSPGAGRSSAPAERANDAGDE